MLPPNVNGAIDDDEPVVAVPPPPPPPPPKENVVLDPKEDVVVVVGGDWNEFVPNVFEPKVLELVTCNWKGFDDTVVAGANKFVPLFWMPAVGIGNAVADAVVVVVVVAKGLIGNEVDEDWPNWNIGEVVVVVVVVVVVAEDDDWKLVDCVCGELVFVWNKFVVELVVDGSEIIGGYFILDAVVVVVLIPNWSVEVVVAVAPNWNLEVVVLGADWKIEKVNDELEGKVLDKLVTGNWKPEAELGFAGGWNKFVDAELVVGGDWNVEAELVVLVVVVVAVWPNWNNEVDDVVIGLSEKELDVVVVGTWDWKSDVVVVAGLAVCEWNRDDVVVDGLPKVKVEGVVAGACDCEVVVAGDDWNKLAKVEVELLAVVVAAVGNWKNDEDVTVDCVEGAVVKADDDKLVLKIEFFCSKFEKSNL